MDAILVQSGFGQDGGVTVDVLNLAGGLEERGHSPRLVGSPRDLLRELHRSRDALVHVFGCLPSVTTFSALATGRLRRRPLVWTPIFNPIRRHTWAGYGLLRAMEAFDAVAPRAARFVDAVIAATPAEASFFAGLGSPRVEVIPPGVAPLPPPAHPDDLSAFRERVGADPGPLVLTVARDNSRKALPFGLRVFEELRARAPNVQLLLVGPDADFYGGRQPGVRCPGWLDQEEIALAYQAADVLFVPSLYEGLPRAVIESWRFGTPVVATDRVALAPAIAEHGGRVVPYGDVSTGADALFTLLTDPAAAARLGQAGRRLVAEEYLMPALVDRTAAVYHDLVQGRRV